MEKILIIIALVLFYSCKGKPDDQNNISEAINLDRNDKVSVYDLFSKIEIIPLETTKNSVLAFPREEPDRMVIDKDSIYILDTKQESISVFDPAGRFVRKIDHHGNGPGEYTSLSDFNINRYTGNMEVLSAMGRYINVYDRTGTIFIERINFPDDIHIMHNFHNLTPDIYAFFSGVHGGEILLYSKKKAEKIPETVYQLPQWMNRTVFSSPRNPFYVYNDSLFFEQMYNGEVYSITANGELISRYKWDFGKYNFELDEMPKDQTLDFYLDYCKKISRSNAVLFQIYGENIKYYFTRFKFKNRYKHLIFEKGTGNSFLFNEFSEGMQCLPLWIDDKAMYTVTPHEYLSFVVKPSVLSEEDQVKLQQITEDDNPIIIKYTFK